MDRAASAPSSKLARFFGAVPKALWCVFLAYIVVCIVLDVAVAPFLDFRCKWLVSFWGFALLPLALVIGGACCVLARRLPRSLSHPFLAKHGFTVFVLAAGVLLFCVESVLMHGGYFIGSDVGWGLMIRFDDPRGLTAHYFIFPNKYFIGGLISTMYSFGYAIGADPHLALLELNCLVVTVSVCLTGFTARALGGTRCGLCAFALAFVFIGFSPYFMVAYTDTFGLIFTTSILCLYACCKHPVKWPLMTFLAVVGCNIKPTSLAAFGGAVLVSGCLWLKGWLARRKAGRDGSEKSIVRPRTFGRAKLFTFAGMAACSVIGVILASGLVSITRDQVGITLVPNHEVVPAHYLMMGFNDNYDGTFNNADCQQSWAADSAEEMTESDLAVWRTRVHMLGPSGVLHLMVKKNLINYDNGDFQFYRPDPALMDEVRGDGPLVQRFYGIQETPYGEGAPQMADSDQVPSPWAWIAQVLWFLTLAGVAFCWFRKRPTPAEMAATVALLLLSGFLLLFECSARYLYLYSSFYVILGVRGWQAFGQHAARRLMCRRDVPNCTREIA